MAVRAVCNGTNRLPRRCHIRRLMFSRRITPYLWFDDNAEEAVNFYISILRDSRIVTRSRSWPSSCRRCWRWRRSMSSRSRTPARSGCW